MSHTLNLGFTVGPKTLIASPGSFFVQGPPVPFSTTASNLSLTGATGAFSLSGQAATLASNSGQLPTGHFVSAVMPMTSTRVVIPRPDTETSSAAYTRNAHPNVQYVCPVVIQGGSFPHWYEIITAPPGATIGSFYNSTDYGVVRWTPTSGTKTFTIRVHDQDGTTVDVTWTVTVGTTWVLFVDSVNGNDTTGTGTFAAPWKTYSKAATSVTGGKSICLRAGTYSATTASQNLTSSTHLALFAYPGESVTMDCSTSTANGGCWNEGGSDIYVSGIAFSSGPSAQLNPRCFTNQSAGDRLYKIGCSFDNPPAGTAGSGAWDNQACWFLGDAGAQRKYCLVLNCTFSRLPAGGNGYMAYDLYNTAYFVSRANIFNAPGTTGQQYVMFHKGGGNVEHTAEQNVFAQAWTPANAQLGAYFGSDGSGGQSTHQEFRYNTIVNSNTAATWNSFAMIVNNAQNNSFAHQFWSYRNTIVGIPMIAYGTVGTLDFTSINDVIVHNATATSLVGKWIGVNSGGSANTFINPTTIPNISSYSITGVECQGNTSAGILDASNLLTGTFRTTYLGLRGAEIA